MMPYTKPDDVPYSNSSTSRAAAQSQSPRVNSVRERVFVRIFNSQGFTCDEIECVLDLPHQTASARIRDLVMKDRVVDSRARRPTRTGRQAIVWVAKQPRQGSLFP